MRVGVCMNDTAKTYGKHWGLSILWDKVEIKYIFKTTDFNNIWDYKINLQCDQDSDKWKGVAMAGIL